MTILKNFVLIFGFDFIMSTPEDTTGNVARVSVKPPPFWRANPKLWFTQMESQFLLANVTTENTKFHHVVSTLQPEELSVVGDILLKPPADAPYTALKDRLCAQYAESEEQQFRDLISGMQLGDRKPSRLLLEMKSKAGSGIGDSLMKSLFLQRLPTHVQQILATSKDNIEQLAEMADGIMAVSTPTTSIHAVESDRNDLHATLMDISARLSRLETHRNRSSSRNRFQRGQRSRSPSADRNTGLCWYHYKFKQQARKCKKPCSFEPGN